MITKEDIYQVRESWLSVARKNQACLVIICDAELGELKHEEYPTIDDAKKAHTWVAEEHGRRGRIEGKVVRRFECKKANEMLRANGPLLSVYDIPESSDLVKAICKKFWKVGVDRVPLKECCGGCPLYSPCNRGYPTSVKGIMDRHNMMQSDAELVTESL